MATIKINNLNTSGSDLFNDSESYLTELTEEEMNLTGGFGVCRPPSTFRCSSFRCWILRR
jgi:hypothetical protein